MKQYTALLGVGVAAIGAMAVIFGADVLKMTASTQAHDIFVDPLLDRQSLFVMGRVTIQNTGYEPLTNVHVDFGAGDTLRLGTLGQGQRVMVSPPPENPMEFVMVSADDGVFVSKAYREMPKMVGMMGS